MSPAVARLALAVVAVTSLGACQSTVVGGGGLGGAAGDVPLCSGVTPP